MCVKAKIIEKWYMLNFVYSFIFISTSFYQAQRFAKDLSAHCLKFYKKNSIMCEIRGRLDEITEFRETSL